MGFLQKVRNITNFSIIDKTERAEIERNLNVIKADQMVTEQYKNVQVDDDGRPSLGMPYLDTSSGAKYPLWRIPPARLYWLAEEVSDFRVILDTIRWEMFKNGIRIDAAYKYKCEVCDMTYTDVPSTEYVPLAEIGEDSHKVKLKCSECGNDDEDRFRRPKPEGRRILSAFLQSKINDNGQRLMDVAKQSQYDIDVVDGSYTLVSRDYRIKRLPSPDPMTGATAEVAGSTLVEMLRINPSTVSIIADDDGKIGWTRDRRPAWICPNYNHRTELLEKPFCDKCGTKAFTAFIESSVVPFGPPVSNVKRMYYSREEVVWRPYMYRPDLLYGMAPAVAIWKKILSLYSQDEYLWKYFDKNRPPKSVLVMGSRNQESVKAFWKRNQTGAAVDPYMPRPILLNTENIKQAIEFIDLTPNFKELELSSVRNEMRNAIGVLYGVQPIFIGESPGGGSSQGSGSKGGGAAALGFTVTNRRIKAYQKDFNETFFDPISRDVLGVEDWKFVLVESEEVDILREHQTKGVEIANAVQMYGMGFDVRTDGNGNIEVSQFPNPERQQMMAQAGGKGENISRGNTDKNKKTTPDREESTNFSGEPLGHRASDDGGVGESSPTSGFSFGDKMARVMEKGLANDWTLTHMAKELARDAGTDADTAKREIKKKLREAI